MWVPTRKSWAPGGSHVERSRPGRGLWRGIRSLLLAAAFIALGRPAWSQQESGLDSRRTQATRSELGDLLKLYEQSAASTAYSDSLRARSRQQALQIRQRLERGDFQTGDRIILSVEREPALTETFVVTEGPALRLPTIREVSLVGVLRSELESHLRTQVARFVEDPQVRARSMIRISVVGAVPQQGFFYAPSEALLTDALLLAGGPGGGRIDGITIERDGQRIWTSDQVREAIVDGRTLDQLDVRPGDRIKVPARGRVISTIASSFQWVSMLVTLPISVFTLTRIF